MNGDPYRPIPTAKAPRYVVVIDGIRYSGETFGAVIRELRFAGFVTEQISEVAATVTASPGQTVMLTLTTGEL